MKKNILSENMRRFGTKNLNEQEFDPSKFPDPTEQIPQDCMDCLQKAIPENYQDLAVEIALELMKLQQKGNEITLEDVKTLINKVITGVDFFTLAQMALAIFGCAQRCMPDTN